MDKTEVARRNLGMATHLFLRDYEPVAVHTLVATAAEVLDELVKLDERQPFASILLKYNPDLTAIDLKASRNAIWNAMKHVTAKGGRMRDDAILLSEFDDQANDGMLMTAWYDYAELTGAMPIEAQALQGWVVAKDEHDHPFDFSKMGFGRLRSLDRRRQKEQLRRTIAKVSKISRFVNDPKTERRPLVARTSFPVRESCRNDVSEHRGMTVARHSSPGR